MKPRHHGYPSTGYFYRGWVIIHQLPPYEVFLAYKGSSLLRRSTREYIHDAIDAFEGGYDE